MTFKEKVESRIGWIALALSLLVVVVGVRGYFNLAISEMFGLFTLFGIVILAVIIWSGFEDITDRLEDIANRLDRLTILMEGRSPSKGNPPEVIRREERRGEKTTGTGALSGMMLGGIVGLTLGSVGVIIGGLIGALIGDELERVQLRKRRK